MVKKLWLLSVLLCASWPGWVAAEVRMTVRADKKTVLLGEPLLVEIKGYDVREPLSSIKLDKLKKNFDVYGISSNVSTRKIKGRAVSAETMSLILYPLRSGKIQIPVLDYGDIASAPLMVSVLESDKHSSRVIFKAAIDSAHPQVRQAVTLTLEIYDDGSPQWTAPREIVAASAHQRRLAETQREEMIEGVRYTVHRYAWALMPLREGAMMIEFPMLDAFKFGTRLRYAVAPLWINAAPVPAYLPVHVPIGKPVVSVEQLPGEIALNRPVTRVFSVQGSGISAEGISKLLSVVRSSESLRFYPFKIASSDKERPTSAIQILLVTLPFVPLTTGMLQIPEINLPYYNPESARVESVLIPGAVVEVFNPLWHTVKMVALGLMVLAGVSGTGYGVFKQLRRVLKRRKDLLAVKRAVSAGELRTVLLNFDVEITLTQRHTLQQWLQSLRQAYGVDERLFVIVQKLESMQYGADVADAYISGMASEAASLLSKLTVRKGGRYIKNNNRSLLLSLFNPPAGGLK